MAEQREWRTEWSNGGNGRMAGMADGMVECKNGEMVEWRPNGGMVEWQEWRNGMVECGMARMVEWREWRNGI